MELRVLHPRRFKVSVGRTLSNSKATNDFNNKASDFIINRSKKMSKASCFEGSFVQSSRLLVNYQVVRPRI